MNQHNQGHLFTHKSHVRIDDINFGNHLCHSKFINIFHNTRALFLKKNNISESNFFGYGLIMLNLNINYHSQCFFDDLLEITLDIDTINRATCSLKYSAHNLTTNKVAATATTLMGCLDIKKGRLAKLPNEFLKLITINN